MMKISAFVDCNSESIVLRIPYEMVVDMLLLLPETEDKKELKNRVITASARSNKLRELLEFSFCHINEEICNEN